ncbi:FkbM family methyltransferase [Mucilaginibacter sp. McL0603]|uniref:FkbM family methyltransferase n=1 Tax=Mucilaginibacter sp. McL0603 TaxID=3415670 RepID=UPI003CF0860F
MKVIDIFQPGLIIEKLAHKLKQEKRLKKLKNTVAYQLQIGHIDSLELIEAMIMDSPQLKEKATIYDIGSNIGTWTLLVKSFLPNAIVYAFEPLENHNTIFKKNCESLSGIHLNDFCLGNTTGTGILNISSYSDASTLLVPTKMEFEDFGIRTIGQKDVTIKRLYDLIKENTIDIPDIIKLDIQGFELEALKGMGDYIKSVRYLICEVSFKEYYHDQPQFLEIITYLGQFNFRLFAMGYNTPIGKKLNQVDVLFKRID